MKSYQNANTINSKAVAFLFGLQQEYVKWPFYVNMVDE